MKLCQCRGGDAQEVRKVFEEDSVAKGIKDSREVKEDESAVMRRPLVILVMVVSVLWCVLYAD